MTTSARLLAEPSQISVWRRPGVLVAAAVVALAAVGWSLSVREDSDPDTVVAVRTRASRPSDTSVGAVVGFAKRDIMAIARDLFSSQSWVKPPPPVVVRELPPPPPTAPPLPFSMIGSYEHAGDPTVFFLVQGDVVRDVRVGDVIDGTYSVDGARDGRLQLTYLPLKIRQEIAVGSN